MDLASYIQLFRRWFWLVGLATVVAAGASYLVARNQTLLYQTTTLVQVGTFTDSPSPDTGLIATAHSLAQSYFIIAKTTPVLQSIITTLKLPTTTSNLAGAIKLDILPGTAYFTITVIYDDPEQAANIANQMALELIKRSPTDLPSTIKEQIVTLQTEIDSTKTQLDKDRAELATIEKALADTTKLQDPSQDAAILTARRSELQTQINIEQNNLTQLLTRLDALQSRNYVNVLTVVEPAAVPTQSLGTSTFRDTLLAGIVGAVLSVGVIALLEQLNTTIKSPGEIMMLLNVPVIGLIPSFGRKGTYKKKLIAWTQARSAVAEAYRALRVNLMYMERDEDLTPSVSSPALVTEQCFVITSSIESEGKSVTAANLAISFAIAGRQVVLIDADLRRPSQHSLFGLPNTQGLSNILKGVDITPEEKPQFEGDPTVDDSFFANHKNADEHALLALVPKQDILFYTIAEQLPIQRTEIPRLSVITSGPLPPNPADLLSTGKIKELIYTLAHDKGFDVVIFDTPPALDVSDSQLLANSAEAPVLLVVESGRTRRAAAVATVERFAMLSIEVIGVVFNRAKTQHVEHGFGTYYTDIVTPNAVPIRRKQITAEKADNLAGR